MDLSKAIAWDGHSRYVIEIGQDETGQIFDSEQDVMYPEQSLGSIFARGYWQPYQPEIQNVKTKVEHLKAMVHGGPGSGRYPAGSGNQNVPKLSTRTIDMTDNIPLSTRLKVTESITKRFPTKEEWKDPYAYDIAQIAAHAFSGRGNQMITADSPDGTLEGLVAFYVDEDGLNVTALASTGKYHHTGTELLSKAIGIAPGLPVTLYSAAGAKSFYEHLGMEMIEDSGGGNGAIFYWNKDEAMEFAALPREMVHGGPGSGRYPAGSGKNPQGGRAIDFKERPQDFAAYKNAPDLGRSIMSMNEVQNVRDQLQEQGRLNDDGRTVSLYHVTSSDDLESIMENGLVPGFHEATGQTWKATHSDYATYFFGDKDRAIEQAMDVNSMMPEIPDAYVVIEAKIPITPKSLIRVLPDEDTSPDPNDGISELLSGGAVAYIGGVPAHSVSRLPIPKVQNVKSKINALGAMAHGGPGSGRYPKGSGSNEPKLFDKSKWAGKRDEWSKLSVGERDRLAEASTSVKSTIEERLSALPAWGSGDIDREVNDRINNANGLVSEEARGLTHDVMAKYTSVLRNSGVPEEKVVVLSKLATDTLLAQEIEAQGRQLGDHGIHHVEGNIERSIKMMSVIPGEWSPEQESTIYLAQVFHDAGYLTEPSQAGLDEGHPRWSQQHFDANVRPAIEDAFGKNVASEVSYYIRSHDSNEINWKEDPAGSSIRVADNTALFQEDKLPPMFRDVPSNVDTLFDLQNGKIDMSTAKSTMRSNIEKSSVSKPMKERFNKAVDEVNPATGKFTLGMLGGTIDKVSWVDDHVAIDLKENGELTKWNKLMDLGQRQFGKFAEAYGANPDDFKKSLDFKFESKDGQTLLEGRIIKSIKSKMDSLKNKMSKMMHGGPGSGRYPAGSGGAKKGSGKKRGVDEGYGYRQKGYTKTERDRINSGPPQNVLDRDLKGSELTIEEMLHGPERLSLDKAPSFDTRSIPQNAMERQGQCFELGTKFQWDNPDWNLVHATLYPRMGPFENEVYFHCYAEKGDAVYDPVFGALYNRGSYEKYYSISDKRSYTSKEAMNWMMKTKVFGSWE